MRVTKPAAFLSPVAAHQQPAGGAGQIGHVRAPLLQDQIQAGPQPIPAFSERQNARVAAAELEGDGVGGKCLLRLVEP